MCNGMNLTLNLKGVFEEGKKRPCAFYHKQQREVLANSGSKQFMKDCRADREAARRGLEGEHGDNIRSKVVATWQKHSHMTGGYTTTSTTDLVTPHS